jgi:hypothetical protein
MPNDIFIITSFYFKTTITLTKDIEKESVVQSP